MNGLKKIIKIKYQNGINKHIAENEIFYELKEIYSFEESDSPDYILFGPYGNDIPRAGNYIRIGYFCENVIPDLTICDWAFGVIPEKHIGNIKYKRIQWHGFNPVSLIKKGNQDPAQILQNKTRFCNFFYSNQIPYRESFFRRLSAYKKVDAPGLSMNNMSSIDTTHESNKWDRKREFLSECKFTIAFENYFYPGYQTEKIYDAMLAESIPIYCGDPEIGHLFNAKSFINVMDFRKPGPDNCISWLEKRCQPDFEDIRPAYYKSIENRFRRKLKLFGRNIKMNAQLRTVDFEAVVQKIIEIDQDNEKYKAMLKEPWLNGNILQSENSLKKRWFEIFENADNMLFR